MKVILALCVCLAAAVLQKPAAPGQLVDIRRGRGANPPSATDLSWRAEQEQLTALSGNSVLVVAEKSGHVIPYDEPAVVADAVRRVIGAWRTNGTVK